MAEKKYSFYREETASLNGPATESLIIEIANSHLACLVISGPKKLTKAFELFTFEEEESEKFNFLYPKLAQQSKILNSTFQDVRVFINDQNCIPVPAAYFNKSVASDYDELVLGSESSVTTLYDFVDIDPGIMNVFRIDNNCHSILNASFSTITYSHTYSSVIKNGINQVFKGEQQFMSVQFHHTFFNLLVIKEAGLQIIQSFTYRTAEDVLYYLFKIAAHYQLNPDFNLHISGLIDLDFNLYREIIKYFKNVTIEDVPTDKIFGDTEHPSHFFTPYYNLI